jgi:hypothetical protein
MSKLFHRLLSAATLTLFLSLVSSAFAGYKPPADQKPPRGNTISGGSRGGCSGTSKIPLTALAPQQYIGLTVSTRPTFAWYIPDAQSYQMEFDLFEYSATNQPKLIARIPLETSQGIMKLSLPESIPDLTVGKTYLWQVAISCKEGFPSSDLITRAQFEITQLKPDEKMSLNAAQTPLQKADIYANAGLWYDALSEALTAENTPQSRAMISSLLEELAQGETSEFSKNLMQIVNTKKENVVNSASF